MTKRLGLRFYLIASQMALIVLMLATLLFVWYRREANRDTALYKENLEYQAQLLAADFQAPGNSAPIPPNLFRQGTAVVYVLSNGTQTRLSSGSEPEYQASEVRLVAAESLQGHSYSQVIDSPDGKPQLLYASAPVWDANGKIRGAICLVTSMAALGDTLSASRNDILILFAAVALAGLLLTLFLSSFVVRSVRSAEKLAARVAEGIYELPASLRGPRETRELAISLNKMAQDLGAQQKSRQMLLSNVTHELARPIGALRLGVDSLQSGGLKDTAMAEDLLAEMNYTLNHMEALVDDLSLAARPLAQPFSLERRCLPLEPLLYGLRSRFWTRAESRNIDLKISVAPSLPPILADEVRLNQMDNALKYTPPGSSILISAEVAEGMIKIAVLDSGPGVSEEELARITEPFFQGKNVKGINQGMGLGLSIVRQLCEAHKGHMRLFNRPEGGLGVELFFESCPLTEG
jgi:signal transduction histidine kinase